MTSRLLTELACDDRTVEADVWAQWLKAAAQIVKPWEAYEDDPFAYNETASVSILTAAAARADLLAIAEYVSTKRHRDDRREAVDGRCDLWMASHQRSWSFEFKQMSPSRLPTLNALQSQLESARACARCVHAAEADRRIGGLIVSTYWMEDDDRPALTERLEAFAETTPYAWRLNSGNAHASPTYFYFSEA